MASTTVQFEAPTGLTLKCELYPAESDTIANGAGGDTATERTNAKGVYEITVTEALTGEHDAVVTNAGVSIGTGVVPDLVDDTATYHVVSRSTIDGHVPQTADHTATLSSVTARIPAALVSGRMDSNVSAINDAAAAAVRLALSAGQIIPGTVEDTTTSPSTTVFAAADITEATTDHFKNRVVLWTSGALVGSVAQITAYTLTSGEGVFTVSTMQDIPADEDTFVII